MLKGAGTLLLMALLTAFQAIAGERDTAADLPLGDRHVSPEPRPGHVFACRHTFNSGADIIGGWLHGDTWTPDGKPTVSGQLMWPFALFHLEFDRDAMIVTSNGLPIDVPTGSFPMASDDPARFFDLEPYAIQARRLRFAIPRAPFPAEAPNCLPGGMIGFTITGVAFYGALDEGGRDAQAHHVLDGCGGRPQREGHYHYYGASPCLPGSDGNVLVGWALDGFPILGMRDATGRVLTNADLDACHGRREYVQIGVMIYGYAYRLTREFPYTLGCFTGDVSGATLHAIRLGIGGSPQPVQQSGVVATGAATSTAAATGHTYPQQPYNYVP